jgi:hypothetical protein
MRAFDTPESVVAEIYKLISFEPHTSPDWEKVKALFAEEAAVFLRVSEEARTAVSREGLIDLFVASIEKNKLRDTGFTERLVSCKVKAFGAIAHCFAVYESSIPNESRPRARGVDSIQLIKRNEGWLVASLTNDVSGPGKPIPEEFLHSA